MYSLMVVLISVKADILLTTLPLTTTLTALTHTDLSYLTSTPTIPLIYTFFFFFYLKPSKINTQGLKSKAGRS